MRRTITMTFALVSVLLSGCGSASTAATQGVTWNLVTVNGASLPFITQLNDLKIEQLSEQLVVFPEGRYTKVGRQRRTDGTSVSILTDTLSGSYTISETIATFGSGMHGVPLTGTLLGDTLTLAMARTTYVYAKQ